MSAYDEHKKMMKSVYKDYLEDLLDQNSDFEDIEITEKDMDAIAEKSFDIIEKDDSIWDSIYDHVADTAYDYFEI